MRVRGVVGRIVLAALLPLACATQAPLETGEPPPPVARPLLVGLSPEIPPLAFSQQGVPVGVELDFARELGRGLQRPVRIVDIPWEKLIDALLDGRIDVIMSGMSVTPARQVRVAFSDPYMRSGLAALVRRTDATKWASPEAALKDINRVGVIRDTTAEKFMHERFPSLSLSTYGKPDGATAELIYRRIDAFIADLPLVVWSASANEADTVPLAKPLLSQESLAWAFRQTDEELRQQANDLLAQWRQDGTRAAILRRWMPYLTNLD